MVRVDLGPIRAAAFFSDPRTDGQGVLQESFPVWRSSYGPRQPGFQKHYRGKTHSIKKPSLVISDLKHLHFLQSAWLGERQEGEFKVACIDWLGSPKEGPLPALPITIYSIMKRELERHPPHLHPGSCFPLPVNYDVIILHLRFRKPPGGAAFPCTWEEGTS